MSMLLHLSLCAARPALAQQVARFRINGKPTVDRGRCTLNIIWQYGGVGQEVRNGSYHAILSGKGVRFFVFKGIPGYDIDLAWQRAKGFRKSGLEIGRVDMQPGNGQASLSFDLSQAGLKSGDACSLVGLWPNGHQWGCDPGRPGGQFTVP
ncbi:MAG: hypothetical protein H6707_01910 [Deltaproteobacteria bacterium]|nr:hypothetical protein [Deltaproteobacteria bacterium]